MQFVIINKVQLYTLYDEESTDGRHFKRVGMV